VNSAIGTMDYGSENRFGVAGFGQSLVSLPQFAQVYANAPERREVESYIQAQFHRTYGARVANFLPLLLTLRCGASLSGVAGVALAKQHSHLFLEHYLDAPVECVLQQYLQVPVARGSIAEIGNLVATTRGASRLIFIVLASVLYRAGLEWMVFTATAPLQASLRRLGFTIIPVQSAVLDRLPDSGTNTWGSYYANAPSVVAGRLDSAMQLIDKRALFSTLQSLYHAQIVEFAAALAGERQ